MADYDDYLYDDFPFAPTHPDHLATIAALFGLRPAPPARCRVLELGCGLGGNLIPMALTLPGSSFVGVDGSARQIAAGLADVEILGLDNIELLALDILDVDAAFGPFDYILCHGVYSWVPPEVRAKILQICRAHLAPDGVAYISFNTLPGWHLRGTIRDMLQREVGSHGTPEERVARARAFLRFLDQAKAIEGPAQAWLESEIELLGRLSDAYLYYEHLAAHGHPMYFQDFAADAERAGLQYLADAYLQGMMPDRLGPAIKRSVAKVSRSIVDAEHYMDLLELKSFRRALLCAREAPVDREVSYHRLSGLWVRSLLLPASASPDIEGDAVEAFSRPGTTELRTSLPILKAALVLLGQDHPRGLPFEELTSKALALLSRGARGAQAEEDTQRLGSNLLGLFTREQIDLGAQELPYVTDAGPRPSTTALVRLQVERGRAGCTNLRHQSVAVDSFDRALLRRLDGTRTCDDLVQAILGDLRAGVIEIAPDDQEGRPEEEALRDRVEQALSRLARAALLVS